MAKDRSNSFSLHSMLGWTAAGLGLLLAGKIIYHELTKYNFKNKVILITGGSRGLGLVLARQLAEKGAKLAICARSEDQLNKARLELEANAQVLALRVDLNNNQEVQHMISNVISHFGQLDVLINNAGIVQVGPVESMTLEDYEKAMQTNFWAPLYTIKASLPYFLKKGEGRIINISSIGGKIAIPHLSPYTASKFALTGLSEGLHAELKKHNIHVTTIIPNLMRTGSPRNIDVKGNHEAEYAWFKFSDSLPLISQRVEVAAKNIIRAIEYGDSEAILTMTAKAFHIIKGFAPGWINSLMTLTNKFLPEDKEGGLETKKGYEAESVWTKNPIAAITDEAAIQNNEL